MLSELASVVARLQEQTHPEAPDESVTGTDSKIQSHINNVLLQICLLIELKHLI